MSDDADRVVYEQLMASNNVEYECIVAPKPPDDLRHCIPLFKKLWALEFLQDRSIRYIAICDCETLFLTSITQYDLRRIHENGFFVNKSSKGYDVNLKYFQKQWTLQPNKKYGLNPIYYWWFNDIPVYDTNLVEKFLSWLRHDTKKALNGGFDQILYGMYRHDFESVNFTMIDQEKHRWGCVEFNSAPLESLRQTSWCTKKAYDKFGAEQLPNIKMILRLERFETLGINDEFRHHSKV